MLFLGVVPVMLALTLWFRKASDVAFLAVRDRIADVMSDLQESLAGIRIVTATNRAKRNVVAHDNVLGAHSDANDRTAVIGAVYGPAHRDARLPRPGHAARHRRLAGAAGAA